MAPKRKESLDLGVFLHIVENQKPSFVSGQLAQIQTGRMYTHWFPLATDGLMSNDDRGHHQFSHQEDQAPRQFL